MEFLGKLGIDVKLLIAQIINFGLLLWLLKRFLYKPIIKQIEEDEEELKQAKLQKESLEKERADFAKQMEQETIRSKKRAQKMIKESEAIAQEIKKQAQEEAEKEKSIIIKQIKSCLNEAKKSKR